ncbi:methyltransferase family protein [Natronosalvus caseinilyticus]|uniref:methyltransferase family protein n=1 Tax=Natronosalvus caseinilyticus TaxID=2953747 RepID=UPI0028A6F0DF|nr:phosphatidylethanolamine N-methyltransferase family protein [Natronosalvus caseinilyticus]
MIDWIPLHAPERLAFVVAASALSLNFIGVLATIAGRTDYWPPGERDRRFYAQWTLAQTFSVCLLVVAVLDWNGLGLPRTPTLVAGLVLFVPGFAAALAAGRDLGSEETVGLTGELRTGGWYRYSRNPQYVAYLVATVGFALLANSAFVAALCGLYACWWLLLPLAEEPWLREQYGEAYERYAEVTPRFVGLRTLRRLSDERTERDAAG